MSMEKHFTVSMYNTQSQFGRKNGNKNSLWIKK